MSTFDARNQCLFYSHRRGRYRWASNFYWAPFTIDRVVWPTTEHYFQAMKFHDDDELRERVRRASTPGEAAKIGRDRENPLRKDWEDVKEDVMLVALRAKFAQHPELRAALLSTSGKWLVEHTERDHYWGDGGGASWKNGEGRGNRLGVLLMQVRDEFKSCEYEPRADPRPKRQRAN